MKTIFGPAYYFQGLQYPDVSSYVEKSSSQILLIQVRQNAMEVSESIDKVLQVLESEVEVKAFTKGEQHYIPTIKSPTNPKKTLVSLLDKALPRSGGSGINHTTYLPPASKVALLKGHNCPIDEFSKVLDIISPTITLSRLFTNKS